MDLKTNFSFEVHYPAESTSTLAQRNALMDTLGPQLQQLLAAQDAEATVAVSDSHRGAASKLVELTSTLQDAQIASILQVFAKQHDVSVSAFE